MQKLQVTITFEVDMRTANAVLQSSIERVINTSMAIVSQSTDEDAGINYEDWQEWKPVIRDFWSALWNHLYCAKAGQTPTTTTYRLRKGEL